VHRRRRSDGRHLVPCLPSHKLHVVFRLDEFAWACVSVLPATSLLELRCIHASLLCTTGRYAPFFSGGGYCSEATAFVMELHKHLPLRIFPHGDGYQSSYVDGLPASTKDTLRKLYGATTVLPSNSIAICHSEPGAWHPPGQPPSSWEHVACPPPGARYSIGRTMFETDRLPDGWAPRLNAMDEVWVPSAHSRDVFERGGVMPSKLHVLGEPVDTDFFDPNAPRATTPPFELPSEWPMHVLRLVDTHLDKRAPSCSFSPSTRTPAMLV
jgi:hypothetical protein